MSSLAPLLMSVIGGGSVTSAVAAARWIGDERTRRRTEKKQAERAPLAQKSLELRVAEQAGEIQQQTIENLRKNYAELQEQFAQYRREMAEQRQRDIQEHERLREHDRQELERARAETDDLRQKINDSNAVIARMEFELQRYRSAAGP